MYILLILFFISLLCIIVMIWKKLILLRNDQVLIKKEVTFELPYLKEIRHFTIKNTRKYGHISLITILRFHIRSTNFLKNKYGEIKIKVKNMRRKNINGNQEEKKEVSKFLKMISEYKRKIREIKHKIKEEENL